MQIETRVKFVSKKISFTYLILFLSINFFNSITIILKCQPHTYLLQVFFTKLMGIFNFVSFELKIKKNLCQSKNNIIKNSSWNNKQDMNQINKSKVQSDSKEPHNK